jgi:hypothetical protein
MAESSIQRRRLLAQAVRGFAQRHPDYTMAAIENHIAGAVGISAASVQRWRAGYPIAEWHISALTGWAVRQAGMDRRWLRAFLRHCAFTDPGLQERLFESSTRPSLSGLHQACQAANIRLWGSERLASAAAVHLARAAPLRLIASFLASDKPGLILVGASGLGKTSLVLWLATHQANLDRPVLVYPAALLDGERPLSQLLHDTLEPHLHESFPGDESPLAWPIGVVFDGVNESPEMTRLTSQIDRGLVEAQGLKVMLTFRPESFQIALQSLSLSEHCYFCADLAGAGSFPAVQLAPFTTDELAQAYELYRRVYALQTPYAGLLAPLREALRHPLTLQLVAQTFAREPLPEQVNDDQLVQLLLEAFVAQGRLQRADLRFLQDELMPSMIAPGRWSNVIPAEQMAGAYTADGRHLFRPGEPGAITRLTDAGLLATTNNRLSAPLRFTHERFYEHFAWRRLRQLRAAAPDSRHFYGELAEAPPFLHGPARRLLCAEIATQPVEWLADLVMRSSNTPARDFLLGAALEDWGRAHPGKAHAYLDRLWAFSQSSLARALHRIGLPAPEPRPEILCIQRVAVTVASALGDSDFLVHALLTAGQMMQQVAVAKVLLLWQTDPQAAERILSEVGRRVTGRLGWPNWSACLAFLQLAGLTLFEFGQRTRVRVFLRDQMRLVVRRVFGPPWRRLLLRLVIHWLVDTWERHLVMGLGLDSTLDSTFQIPPQHRQHLQALARLMDWETQGLDTAAAREHIQAALEMGGLVAIWFPTILLTVRGLLRQPEAEALILTLLREACETQPPRPWAIVVNWIANNIMSRQPCTDRDWWAALDDSLSGVIASYPQWHESYRASRLKPPRRLVRPVQDLSAYLVARDIAGLPIEEGAVWAVVAERLAADDAYFILDYLAELRIVFRDFRRPRLALRLMRPALSCEDEAVQRVLVDLLAWIKMIAAEDVRELLASGMIPPELAAAVQTWQFEDWSVERQVFGAWDLIFRLLIESRPARQMLSHIFAQVVRFSSMRAWMSWAAQLVLNALAEEELFSVAPLDA